jgi:hypothetical protein
VVLSALGTAHITKVSILYYNLESSSQRELLREMVKKVVVDREGHVLRVDLLPPFAFKYERDNRQIQLMGKTQFGKTSKTLHTLLRYDEEDACIGQVVPCPEARHVPDHIAHIALDEDVGVAVLNCFYRGEV